VAASVAIHGVILLWTDLADEPAVTGAKASVEISVKLLPQPAKRVKATVRSSAERRIKTVRAMAAVEEADRSQLAAVSEQVTQPAVAQVSREARESLIRTHLERYKYYPPSARRRGISGEVEVAFELNRDGQATMLKILTGSGYGVLDEAALETVRRAEPFPADSGAFQFWLRFRAS